MAHLTCTIADGLATIVLDNPPQNRLTVQLCDELDRAVQEISASEARAVLLRAEARIA